MTLGAPPRNQDSFEYRKWLESLRRIINSLLSGGGGGGVNLQQVTVTGTQNGSNNTFTLSSSISAPIFIFLNGQLLAETIDYSISTTTLTMVVAPASTDIIKVYGVVA